MLLSLVLIALQVPQPTLTLPAEVKASPGRLVVIAAETTAVDVLWKVPAGLDVQVRGREVFLVPLAPGRYTVLAIAAAGDKPLAAECTLIVQAPSPVDDFLAKLKSAYAADPSPAKAKLKESLASLYKVAATNSVKDPDIKTVGDLLALMHSAADNLGLGDKKILTGVRTLIAGELEQSLGDVPTKPLDDILRGKASAVFLRISTALEAVE